MKGIDADEFPTIQTAGERPTTRVSQKVLKHALEETIFAAASDEARPILTGVLAKFEGSKLTLAAADNYRIAVRTIDILDPGRGGVGRDPGARPRRARAGSSPTRTTRSSSCSPRPATRCCSTSRASTSCRRLIDGQFPNYQQVLPAAHATRAELDREELLRAVRPAALIASSSANIVKLQVGGDDGGGVVVTATAEVGDYTGDVEAASRATRRRSRSTPATSTTCWATSRRTGSRSSSTGPLSPGVFRPVGDDGYVHVVMPVRTTS